MKPEPNVNYTSQSYKEMTTESDAFPILRVRNGTLFQNQLHNHNLSPLSEKT